MIAEPNGHLIISRVLDSIVEMPSEEEVRIKLGSGLLYREEGEHKTRILEELVHLRARYKGRPGQRAVQGVLAHPVMEALIREKWHTVNYHLRDHIGLWLMFTIAFSCYLRVEINTQLTRQVFVSQQNQISSEGNNTKLWYNIIEVEKWLSSPAHNCVKVIDDSALDIIETEIYKNHERLTSLENKNYKICHLNKGAYISDSSLVIFFLLLMGVSVGFLRKAVLICYHKYQGNAYHGVKHLYKLATTIVILGFTFWTDIQDLKTEPAQPFIHWDDGFVLLEYFIFIIGMIFFFWIFDKIVTLRLWTSYLLDPEIWFQGLACLSAITSVFMKNYLTDSGKGPASGLSAIGIALTWLLIILKIGRYSQEGIGNFATMFHLVLKKLRLYMFAVVILLFGFAFGFWVINHHDAQESDNGFSNFIGSIKSSFIMFFGEFGEFGNILHYSEEVKKSHFITLAAFLILFLMMITISSLGMLNVLIAAIITDYKQNQEEVHFENLAYMAQFAVMVDRGIIRKALDGCKKKFKMSENIRDLPAKATYTYCTLDLCSLEGNKRDHIHVEKGFKNILKA